MDELSKLVKLLSIPIANVAGVLPGAEPAMLPEKSVSNMLLPAGGGSSVKAGLSANSGAG